MRVKTCSTPPHGAGPNDERAALTRDEIEHWATAYIEAQQGDAIGSDHPLWWAVENFMDSTNCSANDRWEAILVILNRNPPDTVIGILAAGPLEDLIADHGADFIDRIELEARRNAAFRHLLGGVWRRGGSLEIWHRVQRIRGEVW